MKKMKITFFYFLFFVVLSTTAAMGADKIEKVVGTIVEKAQVKRNGPDNNNYYGFQTYYRDLKIDASQSQFENLVLKMRVYIDNLDNPGDISSLQNAGNAMIELANNQTPVDTYVQWNVKTLNLKHGWNDLYLPLTTGDRKINFDLSKPLNWFRIFFARIVGEPDALEIRLVNVQLVDKSQLVDPSIIDPDDWNTEYNVADIDYTMEGELSKDKSFAVGKSFVPIDASKHNPKQLYLMMDIDIKEATPGDIAILNRVSGQVELTSGNKADVNEMQWGIGALDWKAGQKTYLLAFSNAGETGGKIDLSNINFMRIYAVNVPADFAGKLNIKVSNVKIVDLTEQTKLPTLFGDRMMFQQNKPINIWGYSVAGKDITVKLYKNDNLIETKDVKTPGSGKWMVTIDAKAGSFDKYKFEVLEGVKVIQTVNDILIGEVWLSCGQSNMALNVAGTIDGTTLMENARNDNIRFFLEPTYPSSGNSTGPQPYRPETDIPGAYWGSGNNGIQVGKLSAVAYSMAIELQQKLNVPIGILNTAVGGSVIEAWIPREEIESDQDLILKLKRKSLYYDEDWWVDDASTITVLYNQKIAPLQGYNIKGMIWYQGESNSTRPEIYAVELDLLKKGVERLFNFSGNDMPFIFSHVAPWATELGNPHALAALAEAMSDAWMKNSNSMAMLPIYDTDLTYVGNVPIHPTNKTPVGKRFATAVMNMVYNKSGEYTAPVFKSMTISENKIVVKFDHVGEGLKTTNGLGDIRGFAICGEDGVYVNANAKIVSANEVEIWSNYLENPKQITYAFATYNILSNLCNSVGIPAAPFRTSRITEGQKYFNPQDWMYADADIWGVDAGEVVGYMDAWNKAPIKGEKNIELSYDETKKKEGKASLKVAYNASSEGVIGVGPVLSHKTVVSQLANFNIITADVLNADARNKNFELLLADNNSKIYKVAIADPANANNEATVYAIGQKTKFSTISFNLKKLIDDQGNAVSNASDILNNIKSIQFTVNDKNSGSFYIDNITFGMLAKDVEELAEPQITAITLSGTSPYPSGSVVNVSAAVEADNPTIVWSCTGGALTDDDTLNPTWTLPGQAGSYKITLTITDAGGTATLTKEVEVKAKEDDASLNSVTVNGMTIDGEEWTDLPFVYDMGLQDELSLQISPTDPSATVSIGKNYSEVISKATIKDVVFTITSGNQSKQYVLSVSRRYPFYDVIYVKWNNTLLTDLRKIREDGFEAIAYQWYRNDAPMVGETAATYSAGEDETDLLERNSEYYLEIKTTQGILRTSAEKPALKTFSVSAYPNPIQQGDLITIDADVDTEMLNGAIIRVVDIQGMVQSTHKVTGRQMMIPTPNAKGTFFVQFVAKNGYTKTMKVITK